LPHARKSGELGAGGDALYRGASIRARNSDAGLLPESAEVQGGLGPGGPDRRRRWLPGAHERAERLECAPHRRRRCVVPVSLVLLRIFPSSSAVTLRSRVLVCEDHREAGQRRRAGPRDVNYFCGM
ncbi:hypothetical protein BUE80_DR009423, partial [Diplocarpon rosae]